MQSPARHKLRGLLVAADQRRRSSAAVTPAKGRAASLPEGAADPGAGSASKAAIIATANSLPKRIAAPHRSTPLAFPQARAAV